MSVAQNAVDWAVRIASDDSHGYSQDSNKRWGNPDFDCSSFVISAYKIGGGLENLKATWTGDIKKGFLKNGFEVVYVDLKTGDGLKVGDVLLAHNDKVQHTALYIGKNQLVHASSSEAGGKYGKDGDQTGREVCVRSYYNRPWDYVLRYAETASSSYYDYYIVQKGDTLSGIAQRFKSSVSELVAINGIKNPDLIRIGQKLIVPKMSPNCPQVWTGTVNTEDDPLNIRRTPNGEIIGQLSKGSSVRIQGEASDGWYKLADQEGYVCAKYIK